MNAPQLILLAFLLINACGAAHYRTLTGIIYVTGNEPFVQLAIEEANHKTHLIARDSPVYQELWRHQGEVLEVKIDRTKALEDQQVFIISYQITQEHF